jgi:hypothetical protein
VTNSRFGVPSEDELVDVELITYPSFDGREIPAWLYRPEIEGRVPVVLSIHGGPEAQELPLYHPLYQYLLSRGIAVLATNIRGSTGYGKTYQRLVQRDWGGGDMKDWEHAVKWLHAQDWVDAERIGVFLKQLPETAGVPSRQPLDPPVAARRRRIRLDQVALQPEVQTHQLLASHVVPFGAAHHTSLARGGLQEEAPSLGIPTITLDQFLDQMGYRPDARAVRLGAGSTARDFPALQSRFTRECCENVIFQSHRR